MVLNSLELERREDIVQKYAVFQREIRREYSDRSISLQSLPESIVNRPKGIPVLGFRGSAQHQSRGRFHRSQSEKLVSVPVSHAVYNSRTRIVEACTPIAAAVKKQAIANPLRRMLGNLDSYFVHGHSSPCRARDRSSNKAATNERSLEHLTLQQKACIVVGDAEEFRLLLESLRSSNLVANTTDMGLKEALTSRNLKLLDDRVLSIFAKEDELFEERIKLEAMNRQNEHDEKFTMPTGKLTKPPASRPRRLSGLVTSTDREREGKKETTKNYRPLTNNSRKETMRRQSFVGIKSFEHQDEKTCQATFKNL